MAILRYVAYLAEDPAELVDFYHRFLGTEELDHGPGWSRPARSLRKEPDQLRLDVHPDHRVPSDRVAGVARPIEINGHVDGSAAARAEGAADRRALVHERGPGHPPAAPEGTELRGRRQSDVFQEHLVELGITCDLS